MENTFAPVSTLGTFFALSIFIANPAQAADAVSAAVTPTATDTTIPAVQTQDTAIPAGTLKPAETANTADTVNVEVPAKAKPKSQLSANIGIETFKDTTVPGQEVSQMNIPLGLSVESERVTFEINIPYIQRTAPSGKIAHSEHHESKKDSAAAAPVVSSSGLGDVTSSLMFTILNEQKAPLSLYAKGKIKLATADMESGLGTGQNDYFGELKVSKTLGDFSASASLGYAILGSPGEVKINDVKKSIYFNNIYFGSVGGSYQFTERLNTDVHLDLGQASETGGFEQRDLSLGMGFEFSKNKSLRLQVMRSVTPGLSIWGAGAYISTPM